ncbi:hypothetical protein [Burkholderia stagnalis]|uniref:hypothetical protein n=1 Tax=Burkholderia stagnalis TaxID=1503054 RepID=UPI000ADFED51|nr:hypothetical protein [Burkholderia stagnalis]
MRITTHRIAAFTYLDGTTCELPQIFLRAGPGRDAGKAAEHDERTGAGRRRENAPRDDDARQAARA